MKKRWLPALFLALVFASGCMGLWQKPLATIVVQVEGLAYYPAAHSLQWRTTTADNSAQTGLEIVSEDQLQIDIELTAGISDLELKLLTEDRSLLAEQHYKVESSSGQRVIVEALFAPEEPEEPDEEEDEEEKEPWIAWDKSLQPPPTGILPGDNGYQTPYYVIQGATATPVVVVVGGMHGNEPAGSLAAWRFASSTLLEGTLIVIPELNRLGLQVNQRTGAYPRDPNRCYPQSASGSATDTLSRHIWDLVKEAQPDVVLDLHEGYSFHKINKNSVGQSVIHYGGTTAQHAQRDQMVAAMIKAANTTVSNSNHHFSHLHNPVPGSIARAAGQFLGASGMTLETCRTQTLSLRIRQHETMVNTVLSQLGMI